MPTPGPSRRTFVAASAALALLGRARPAAAAAPVSVSVINTGSDDVLTMQTLIQQQHFDVALGVTPTTLNVSDGLKVLDAVVSGGSDIGILGGFAQVFPAIEQGAKLKLVAGAMLPPDYVIMTKNPAIKSLKDLEGKTVGTGAIGALLYAVVVAMLRKENVDPNKVTFVNIGSSSSVFRAIAAGKVDAGPAEHDYQRIAAGLGVRTIADAVDVVPLFTMQASYASEDAIAKKRDVLVRILAAYLRGYRLANSPRGLPAYIAAFNTVVPGDSEATAEATAMWNWINKTQAYDSALVLSPERVNYMQQLNVSLGVQKSVLPYAQVADMSLAREALTLAGKA